MLLNYLGLDDFEKAYEIAGRNGEPRGDIAWRIRNIQTQMGIEKCDFPELEGVETDDEETSEEKTELRREEKEESGGDSNLNFGTNEEWSEYTEQWSEQDKQLRKEREAEANSNETKPQHLSYWFC